MKIKLLLSGILLAGLAVTELASARTIDFAYIGSADDTALLGVKQGITEANLQGEFLGFNYRLEVITDSGRSHDYSRYLAIMTAVPKSQFIALTKKLTARPIFNLNLSDNSLRTACINNALHTIPSDKMKEDARAQWYQKEGQKVTARAWHHDFKKFAARDLNKRFRHNHRIPMDDYAWAGWAAVKMSADAIVRGNIKTASALLQYLKTELAFDGQKGSGLTFRKTGQLRQLLLLVDGGIVGEAPVRKIAKPPVLDSLGLLNCNQ